jgi:hypothetical protein
LCRIDLQDAPKEQNRENVGRRQVAAGVAKLRMVGHGHRAEPDPVRFAPEPFRLLN